MKKIYKKVLDEVIPYKPGKPIEEVKREIGLDEVIKLASNENPFSPSEKVLKAIAENISEVNRYPDGGCFYLRKALSEKLSISGENIVFGNGSDEVIILTLRAFLSPGDEVVISDPTFMVYKIASKIEGAELKVAPAKEFKHDLEGVLSCVTDKTKIIFIANPENPTGSYIRAKELDEFIEKLPEDVVLFMDEAYYEFASGGDYPETLSMIEKTDRNIIIARTFSKVYGLAGLRIGYALAREDIAELLNKVREPFNVNSLAQVAAVAALKDDEYVKKNVDWVKKEKQRFYDFFESVGFEYVPSRTNFILFDTARNSTELFNKLLYKGVIVRDMTAWGIKGFLRVNIGTEEENNKFISALQEVIKGMLEK